MRDIDAAPPRGLRTSLYGPDAAFFRVQDVSLPQRYALSAASKPEPEKDIYVVTVRHSLSKPATRVNFSELN